MKTHFGLFFAVFLLIAPFLSAQNTKENTMFTYKVGDFEITLLPEVQQSVGANILIGATPEMIKECSVDGTFPNAVNAFLVRTSGKNILIDAGYGKKLFENLDSLGIQPGQIDAVLLTHMHGDHIGGLLKDEKPTFPNADIYLPKVEYDYWLENEAKNPYAKRVIEIYKNRIHVFYPKEFGQKPADGLPHGFEAIAAYGHTPGHTAYLINSNKEKMLIWGDLAHAMAIQMPYPQVAVTYDVNPEDAIDSRKKILDYISKNKIPIAGMHTAFPGMGIVEKENTKGYIFKPLQN